MTTNQIIKKLQKQYPKFDNPTLCMIRNPEKYGVQLLPEAEILLTGKTDKQHTTTPPKQPRKPKPTSKRYEVRVSLEEAKMIDLRIKSLGVTNQEYMKSLIEKDILKEFE